MSKNKDGPELCPKCRHGRWTLVHAVCLTSVPHVPSLGTPECPCLTCLRWREHADDNPGVEFTQPYETIEQRQLENAPEAWLDSVLNRPPPRGTWTRGMVNPIRY